MNCNRLVYWTDSTSYTEDSISYEDADHQLKMVYIPISKTLQVIPCLYFTHHDPTHRKTMLYFHGVGEDLASCSSEITTFGKLLDINILAMEYPGYGLNFGRGCCTTNQIKRESTYVLDFLRDELGVSSGEIILFGRSMGTGVAAYLAG